VENGLSLQWLNLVVVYVYFVASTTTTFSLKMELACFSLTERTKLWGAKTQKPSIGIFYLFLLQFRNPHQYFIIKWPLLVSSSTDLSTTSLL
jgi:hypothetical protein